MRYRYERKYLVDNARLDELRARLLPFLEFDKYAQPDSFGRRQYTVRSVYYDTPGFNSLYEKWEGVEIRKKLRIRGYNSLNEKSKVFLEVKRKKGDRIWKNRALVPYDLVNELLTHGFTSRVAEHVEGANAEEARKFLFNFHRYGYRAVNLITYEREPFQGRFEPGLRITCDKNIRAKVWPRLSELFDEGGLSLVWNNAFILEVKYYGDHMPSWVRSIIQEFALRHDALSKFASPFSAKHISIFNLKLGA